MEAGTASIDDGAEEKWQAVLGQALLKAAASGHTRVVEVLITFGAQTEWRGIRGATALRFAAVNGHLEVCCNSNNSAI